MSEIDSENQVVRELLNNFFTDCGEDKGIPSDLLKSIENLRSVKKLAKGNNLKNLLTSIEGLED